ncbi:hypothetical protein GCM10025859_35970 [Alicyclobacillus fastidiosus]|nr:hypothetical protein GCM10025859_35970 [Alicyclobacillus fastidiosus]
MTDSSPAIRARAEEVVRQMIQLALEVGADTVLVVPGLVTEEVSYEQAYERAQLACSRLADEVAGTGVAIAIENVWNRFLLSPLEMRQFIDEINHKEIQVYFDIGNVFAERISGTVDPYLGQSYPQSSRQGFSERHWQHPRVRFLVQRGRELGCCASRVV